MTKETNEIHVGDEVAFNMLHDACWFTVLAIEGFTMTIREVGTDYSPQYMDKSLVKQIRFPLDQ